jgi:hypothetical protein
VVYLTAVFIGSALLSLFKKAIKMRAKHQPYFDKHSLKFTPDVIEKWEKMVADWDKDPTMPNPYAEPEIGESR